MIEADDVEPAAARVAAAVDVIFGIDQKPRRIAGDIPCVNRVNDLIGPADQQAAALRRRGLSRVRNHGIEDGGSHSHYEFSIPNSKFLIAIAMPIPPPMQSEATPYCSFLARSA